LPQCPGRPARAQAVPNQTRICELETELPEEKLKWREREVAWLRKLKGIGGDVLSGSFRARGASPEQRPIELPKQ